MNPIRRSVTLRLTILAAAALLAACRALPGAVPTPTPTDPADAPPTASPSPASTASPTATPTPELSPTPTATPTEIPIGRGNISDLRPISSAGAGSLGQLALSPDGGTLAVAGSRGIWLFDKFTLSVQHHLTDHAGSVRSVAWSPDGLNLISGGEDGTARIWEIDRVGGSPPRQTAVLVGHSGPVNTVTWSPDGGRIATGGEDNAIHIWDGADFSSILSFFHTSPIQDLDWHPASELLLIGEFDGSISIVNTADGSTAASFFFHDGWVSAARWSPDGERVLTGGLDRRLVVWTTDPRPDGTIDLEVEFEIPTLFSIRTAFWQADGSAITAAGGTPYTVQLFDSTPPETEELLPEAIRSFEGHTGVVEDLTLAGGGVLISTSQDNTLRAWNFATGEEVRAISASSPQGYSGAFSGLAWSPSGDRLATSGEDGMLRVWDAATNEMTWAVPAHTGSAASVSWSAAGDWIATGGTDNFTRVWDADTGALVQELHSEGGRVNAVAFAPFGNQLATGGFFRIAQVWAAGTDQSPILLYPDVEITALGWASSGTQLAIGGSDGSVHLFNIPAVAEIGVLSGEHNTPIAAVAWEQGGGRVAAIDRRGTIAVWDTATGELIGSRDGGGGFWGGLSWSPHGLLAAGSDDGTVLFLDASTLKPIAVQAGHAGAVSAVGFSPGGERLASADADGQVRFWALAGPGEPRVLTLPESGEPGAMPDFNWPPAGPITPTVAGEVEQLAVIGRGTALGYDSTDDYIAAAGSTGVWIYDRESREPVRYLEGGRAFGAAFSPDGRYLVARELQLLRVWDIERAVLLRAIPIGLGTQAALAWSPDSGFFAAGERNGTVTVYSLLSGRSVASWGTGAEVMMLDWSPDGRQVAAAAGNDIWLWDLPSREQVALLAGHDDVVRAIDFHPAEPLLLSGGDDLAVTIWELHSIVPPERPDEKEEEINWPEIARDTLKSAPVDGMGAAAWAADGSIFYTQHGCCTIFEWGLASRGIQGKIETPVESGENVGHLLKDGSILTDFGPGEDHLPAQVGLQWLTAGETDLPGLAQMGDDDELRVMELSERTWNEEFVQANSELTFLNLIPGGARLIIRAYSNLNKVVEITQYPGDESGVTRAFWPEDLSEASEHWIAVQAPDSSAVIWNDTGVWPQQLVHLSFQDQMTRTVGILESEVETELPLARGLAWSPDLSRIAAGLVDGRISVYSIQTAALIYEQRVFETVNTAMWSPDGSLIATAGSDGDANGGQQFIRLLDARNGRVVRELALDFAHTATALAFSPDGSLLVSGDSTGDIQIWDVETGERLADLRGHTLSVTSISFSPDGTAVASASRDGTVRIWGIRE